MRRPHLIVGAFLAALGAFSMAEAARRRAACPGAAHEDPAFREQAARVNRVLTHRNPDDDGTFQEAKLQTHLPLATEVGITKREEAR